MTIVVIKDNDNIFLSKKVLFNRSDVLHPCQLQQVQPTPQPTWEPTFRGAFILFFSIFQILFQGANRAGQFWDLEDRRPRLHNRDQRVLHREVARPKAPSEHEPDKETLQRLRAGNLDGQGFTKKSCQQNFEGDDGRLYVFATLGNPIFLECLGWLGTF